ncbi:MAG: hypothetical protein ABIH48_03135 [Candidatus Falkowbacteria bacterium]
MILLIKKIKYKIKDSLAIFLIKLSLLINFPYLAVIAFIIIAAKGGAKRDFKVLCMGRSVFINDVRTLEQFSQCIKYTTIHRKYFQMIFYHFMKGPDEKKLSEKNYHTHNYCQAGKQKYYLFLNKMFPLLHQVVGFDAVLCGNFGYPDQQEFEKICAEKKVPYIVLHKEGLIIPGSEKEWAKICKVYRFQGAKALFYNKNMLNALLNSGFSGISKDNVKIVGMPRLDPYFKLSQAESSNKQILFFSFYPNDKMPGLVNDQEKIVEIKKRIDNFHKWIINFAKQHKDFKVIIKTRLADHYSQYVEDILNNNFKENIDNLVITNIGNPLDLIENSSVVISFNSTTCIKAIVAGRMLISPYFGDLITDKSWDYFEDHPELVNYAKTEEDFNKYILNYNNYFNYTLNDKKEFLDELLGNPDGQSSLRAETAIIEAINEFKK